MVQYIPLTNNNYLSLSLSLSHICIAIIQGDIKGMLSLFWVMIKRFQLNQNLGISGRMRAGNSSQSPTTYNIETGG